MTPEQMREAAAKVARDVGQIFNDPSVAHHVSETIARSIRAIPLTAPEDTMLERLTWVPVPPGQSRRDHASKILEAAREPTEAMIAAGCGIPRAYVDATYRGYVLDIYRAMIDAALAEK